MPYFDQVVAGTKLVDLRINFPSYSKVKYIGCKIQFYNRASNARVIKQLNSFKVRKTRTPPPRLLTRTPSPHTHTTASPPHTHTSASPPHTHTTASPPHTHTTASPPHTHNLASHAHHRLASLPHTHTTPPPHFFQMYVDFKTALQSEGVRSCLPHLQDSDLPAAIEEYYRIKDYAVFEKRYGVLALRLGDFRPSPFRPLSRSEISSLRKILTPQKCLQYVTKIASGSFAHVYKFKRCQGSPHSCSPHSPSPPHLIYIMCLQIYVGKCRFQPTAN